MQRHARRMGGGWGGGTIHHDAVIRNTSSQWREPLEPCCKIVDILTSRSVFLPRAPSLASCSIAAHRPDHLAILLASRGVDLLTTWRG